MFPYLSKLNALDAYKGGFSLARFILYILAGRELLLGLE